MRRSFTPPSRNELLTPAKEQRRAFDTPARQLVLLHIPKTAGTTLMTLLIERFAGSGMLLPENGSFVGTRPEDVLEYRFVSAHVGTAFIDQMPVRPRVITVLRDPVERSISTYFFMRSVDESLITHPAVLEAMAHAREVDLPTCLERYPEDAAYHLGDVQTRFLGGLDPHAEAPADDASFERAVANLKAIDIVG